MTKGGARQGAGRKPNQIPTKPMRVPVDIAPQIKTLIQHYRGELPDDAMFLSSNLSKISIPIASDGVRAGLPSHASSHVGAHLDFNNYLVKNESATFGVYVKGDSMINAGMDEGDLLVVDRSIEPLHKDIVIVEIENEFTVKRLIRTTKGIEFHPENDKYPIIRPKSENLVNFVGVVLYTIKKNK